MERWKPPKDRYYFFIDTRLRKVIDYTWTDDEVDNLLHDMGNCFPTYEEAEKALEMVKELFLSFHKDNVYSQDNESERKYE